VLQRLQDDQTAAFAADEAVAVRVEGRDAFVGSSFRVDIAFIWQKPAMVSGMMIASARPRS